jgi:hypothetical protein
MIAFKTLSLFERFDNMGLQSFCSALKIIFDLINPSLKDKLLMERYQEYSGGRNVKTLLAIYGSPRREGNTTVLLDQAMQGAVEAGGEVEKIVLRDLNMSPCLEIYGCKKTGRCVIQDDF